MGQKYGKKAFWAVATLGLGLRAVAQPAPSFSFQYQQQVPVTVAGGSTTGRTLPNAWAGGLNGCQYSTMRLNADPQDDLVVFDRTTSKVSTFLWTSAGWQYAPDFEWAFPAINNWMLLVDYDADGRKDLFAGGRGDVQVLRNVAQSGNVSFRFELVTAALPMVGTSGIRQPLPVSPADIPAITDVDDDGDVDIVAFDGLGNQATYYKNVSRERQTTPGVATPGLDFWATGVCWGGFIKEFCNDFTFGEDCDIRNVPTGTTPGGRVNHQGNTLTIFDTDGDGRKDALFGHVSCGNVARLVNTGPNNERAEITRADTVFPTSRPVRGQTFQAVFWEDADGDGVKDMLVSPNSAAGGDPTVDYRASSWLYKNVGTNARPDFRYVRPDFLQETMLDLGENATPALGDLDGDGDADLLVGYAGQPVGGANATYRASLVYYENTGTAQAPAFTQRSDDWGGLATTVRASYVVPYIADLDGNGTLDVLISGIVSGSINLWAILNTAPKGSRPQLVPATLQTWPQPDGFVNGERLAVYDVDRDGRPDLLVAKSLGAVNYHRNVGTAQQPRYPLTTQNFGGLATDILLRTRSLNVADLNGDGQPELVSAAQNGQMQLFKMPAQPTETATLLDSLPDLGRAGSSLTATLADLDADGLPDMLLGTGGGGLRYLKNTSQKAVILATEPSGPWLWPNPTAGNVTLRSARAGRADVMTISGQRTNVVTNVAAGQEQILDLSALPTGVYLLRLTTDDGSTKTGKVVLTK